MMSSLCVNGEYQVPPGFRFHPTEEELLQYYLKKKVIGSDKIDDGLNVIKDVDLNKLEPWDIQEKCKIEGATPQSDWYFFSHKDKKYPTGSRTNRATCSGFWKATGRDKMIYGNCSTQIGMRKTLVFYTGRAPHGHKSDWIMHEYRLHHTSSPSSTNVVMSSNAIMGGWEEEGWVICRVFKKKNHKYSSSSSSIRNHQSSCWSMSSINNTHASCKEAETLEETLQYSMTRSSRNDGGGDDDDELRINDHHAENNIRYLKLPSLEHYPSSCCTNQMGADHHHQEPSLMINVSGVHIQDWASLDRLLVASQLNHDQLYSSSSHGNDSRLLMPSFVHHFHASSSSTIPPPYNQPHHLWTSPI